MVDAERVRSYGDRVPVWFVVRGPMVRLALLGLVAAVQLGRR